MFKRFGWWWVVFLILVQVSTKQIVLEFSLRLLAVGVGILDDVICESIVSEQFAATSRLFIYDQNKSVLSSKVIYVYNKGSLQKKYGIFHILVGLVALKK